MKIRVILLLSFAAVCMIVGSVIASSGPATDAVRGMIREVVAIQNDPGLQGQNMLAAKKDAVKQVILKNFNLDEMVRAALGQYYDGLGKAKQDEFKSVFRELFLNSYAGLVLNFVKEEKIAYSGEYEKHNQVTVKTVMKRADENIPVEYALVQTGGKYSVSDVFTDGVSMVGNYRSAFSRAIKQKGFAGLLQMMKLQQQAEGKG